MGPVVRCGDLIDCSDHHGRALVAESLNRFAGSFLDIIFSLGVGRVGAPSVSEQGRLGGGTCARRLQ